MRRTLAALMVVAFMVAGLLLVACGDDGADPGDAGVSSEEGGADDTAADGGDIDPDSEAADGGTDRDAVAEDANGEDTGVGATSGDFCDQVRDLEQQMSDLEGVDPGSTDAVEVGIDRLAALYEDIEPPVEIAEAWRITTSVFDRGAEVDRAELDQAAITSANDAVMTYLRDECGISEG